jgi:hypothetical protein
VFKPKTIKLAFVASVEAALIRRENKDWLALNQDKVSKWSNMSTHRLLFQ